MFNFFKNKKGDKHTENVAPSKPSSFKEAPRNEPSAVATKEKSTKTKVYSVVETADKYNAFLRIASENPNFNLPDKELLRRGILSDRTPEVYQYYFTPGQVTLVPEPDNPQNPNAIKVVVNGEHIGYVKKGSCAYLLKAMGQNLIEQISIKFSGGPNKTINIPENYDRTGAYKVKTVKSCFYAKLEITERTDAASKSAPAPKIDKLKSYKVVGTSFRKDAFMRLAVENPDYKLSKSALIKKKLVDTPIYQYDITSEPVELIPEPDNPNDPNAIKVVVNGEHIGYIKAGNNCAHLLKVIKGNRIKSITAKIYGGAGKMVTKYPDEPYELETFDGDFGAKLEIFEAAE